MCSILSGIYNTRYNAHTCTLNILNEYVFFKWVIPCHFNRLCYHMSQILFKLGGQLRPMVLQKRSKLNIQIHLRSGVMAAQSQQVFSKNGKLEWSKERCANFDESYCRNSFELGLKTFYMDNMNKTKEHPGRIIQFGPMV